MSGPLEGIIVLDFTRVLSGPYCTMQLADMGARVIKIEHPVKGDDTRAWGPPFVLGESAYFMSVNRGKESLALDLKKPQAKQILRTLLAKADVVVENFSAGTMARMGLGFEDLREKYPRLVYCSISGFGQTGPRREERGYDAVVQAEGGLMSITGGADTPPFRLGVAISDIASGMFAAQGIAFALLARERTGRGQLVDIGMLDATAALLTYQAGAYFATGATPQRLGNRHPTIVPYETFDASDGTFVVAVGNDEQWKRFCEATGLTPLANDERFATNRARVTNHDVLKPLLDEGLRTRTRSAWVDALRSAGVPCGSVRDIAELAADPQIAAREMIETVQHPIAGPVHVTGVPIKLSGTPGSVGTAPPVLGQHTRAILSHDVGLQDDEIASLVEAAVVGQHEGSAGA